MEKLIEWKSVMYILKQLSNMCASRRLASARYLVIFLSKIISTSSYVNPDNQPNI